MATVYHAYDPRFERDVAIKVLPHAFLHDPQFRVRFEREAKTIALLEHPAIVPVYDFGEQDEQPYIVMRYMSGGSLADQVKQGAISPEETARLLMRLAPALDAAHARGVIHRDLKPGNVLFDQYGNAFLSDFGIARLSEESGATLTGSAIVGTPAYMSPEQIRGEKTIDGRSDIYALGVMTFQMLTGQAPYQADTPTKVMMMHVLEPVPNLGSWRSDLPGELDAVIAKAMAKQPEERFSTSSEFAAAFETAAHTEPLAATMISGQGATMVAGLRHYPTPAPAIALPRAAPAPGAYAPRTPPPGASGPPTPPRGVTPLPNAIPLPAPRRSRNGLFIAGGIVVVIIVLAVGGLALAGMGSAGPLAMLGSGAPSATLAPTSLPSEALAADPAQPTASPTLPPSPTPTLKLATPVPPVVAPPTDTPPPSSPTPSATPTSNVPRIGGADMVAYFNDSDLWVAYLDGSGLKRLTEDGAAKSGLQWLPGGKALLFISGTCAYTVDADRGRQELVACFNFIESFKAFEVSPDGSQVAVTLDNQLYIVPFDPGALQAVSTRGDLTAMAACKEFAPYARNLVERVRWAKDGKTIAAQLIANLGNGMRGDVIQVFAVDRCIPNPLARDNFPMQRFTMKGYAKNPSIPSYAWDGTFLFAMTNLVRNDGFGDLYIYNLDLHKARTEVNPIDKRCCYRDPSWSPDGSHLIFAFQDFSAGAVTRLYLLPYGAIGETTSFEPLPLPEITDPRESPQPVLRPAQ